MNHVLSYNLFLDNYCMYPSMLHSHLSIYVELLHTFFQVKNIFIFLSFFKKHTHKYLLSSWMCHNSTMRHQLITIIAINDGKKIWLACCGLSKCKYFPKWVVWPICIVCDLWPNCLKCNIYLIIISIEFNIFFYNFIIFFSFSICRNF